MKKIATFIKEAKDFISITLLVLVFLIMMDFMGTGGEIYRFVLIKLGVPEPFALYSSIAIASTYLSVEFWFWIKGCRESKIQK